MRVMRAPWPHGGSNNVPAGVGQSSIALIVKAGAALILERKD